MIHNKSDFSFVKVKIYFAICSTYKEGGPGKMYVLHNQDIHFWHQKFYIKKILSQMF